MAKTFLQYENVIVNVTEIKYIETSDFWDTENAQRVYRIEINRPLETVQHNQHFIFDFLTKEVRDERHELLKINLEGLDWIEFIGG